MLILYYACFKNNASDKWEALARSSIGSNGFDFTDLGKRTMTNRLKTRVIDKIKWEKVVPKVKILWTFTQLVAGFGFVLNVDFPEPYDTVVSVLASVNLSIMEVAPFKCLRPETTFLTDLVVTTLIPIIASAILIAVSAHPHIHLLIHAHLDRDSPHPPPTTLIPRFTSSSRAPRLVPI